MKNTNRSIVALAAVSAMTLGGTAAFAESEGGGARQEAQASPIPVPGQVPAGGKDMTHMPGMEGQSGAMQPMDMTAMTKMKDPEMRQQMSRMMVSMAPNKDSAPAPSAPSNKG